MVKEIKMSKRIADQKVKDEYEVSISPCTVEGDFIQMKNDFIDAIEEMIEGSDVTINTEKESDGFITCSTNVNSKDSGYGNYYGTVKFCNPESIVNFIVHCAGHTKVGSIGFGVEDISSTEVEITLAAKPLGLH